jgi:hypothetical protein
MCGTVRGKTSSMYPTRLKRATYCEFCCRNGRNQGGNHALQLERFNYFAMANWGRSPLTIKNTDFRSAIAAIDQLPETEETLWLRILGRDETQERAIREVYHWKRSLYPSR